ncbi:MAG: hypothetical protein NTY15_19140 [Planctomycetota bacterium]|nr:hypothetical protein [Planctomycetota bacterium]
MFRLKIVCFALVWAFVASVGSCLLGQPRDQARLAVDVVYLKNQRQLRGFVLNHGIDELQIAVSKSWLEKDDRDAYLKAVEFAKQSAAIAKLTLKERLQKLLDTDAQAGGQPVARNGAFNFFLGKELERIDAELENPEDEPYQFVILKIKPATLSRVNIASDQNRKLAVWSWHERLADIETRKPSSLVDELKNKKVDPTLGPPDLSDRFYPTEEGDEQWTVRLAIVSHGLDKPIEFQGSGDVMLLVDSKDQQPDLSSLMGQLMQSQMNSLLEELTGTGKKASRKTLEESDWIKSAISKAEKRKASYFRATNVRTDVLAGTSTVETAFLVQQSTGKWTIAWRAAAVQNMADQKQEAIRRILDDPQVQAIQGQFETAGIDGVSLDKGIRAGAATMVAQKLANSEFQEYMDRYLKSLSQPPVLLPTKK